MKSFFCYIAVIVFFGCGQKQSEKSESGIISVDLTIRNDSKVRLNWVKLEWTGPEVNVGVLSPGNGDMALGVPWPGIEKGTITAINLETKAPYRIDVDFKNVNSKITKGSAVRIQILDTNKAEAVLGRF